jgi:hypothetical protein
MKAADRTSRVAPDRQPATAKRSRKLPLDAAALKQSA